MAYVFACARNRCKRSGKIQEAGKLAWYANQALGVAPEGFGICRADLISPSSPKKPPNEIDPGSKLWIIFDHSRNLADSV